MLCGSNGSGGGGLDRAIHCPWDSGGGKGVRKAGKPGEGYRCGCLAWLAVAIKTKGSEGRGRYVFVSILDGGAIPTHTLISMDIQILYPYFWLQ